MKTTTPIIFNFGQNMGPFFIAAKQNDNKTRFLKGPMVGYDQVLSPSADFAAIVRYKRPDGYGGWYDQIEGRPAIVFDGNKAIVEIAGHALEVPGKVLGSIEFMGPMQERLSAFDFYIEVEASHYADNHITDSDYLNILNEKVGAALQAVIDAQTAAEAAEQTSAEFASEIGDLVSKNDIVDTFDSTAVDRPASANSARVLDENKLDAEPEIFHFTVQYGTNPSVSLKAFKSGKHIDIESLAEKASFGVVPTNAWPTLTSTLPEELFPRTAAHIIVRDGYKILGALVILADNTTYLNINPAEVEVTEDLLGYVYGSYEIA